MRLGVLGGTYDPIHLGHLLLAEQAREALALDSVLLIPAGRPPHKPDRPLSTFSDRLEMVRLSVRGLAGLSVSDLERDTERPSFTVETLRRLSSGLLAADELWLLLGSDSLPELPTWRDPGEIRGLARLAVYPRPGAEVGHPVGRVDGEIVILDGPRVRLSSTEIRDRVREGRSIRFMVPFPVEEYIRSHDLYRAGTESNREAGPSGLDSGGRTHG